MKNNRQAQTSDTVIMKRAFWIVGIFICLWFSGCQIENHTSMPEGYVLVCNETGQYTWKDSDGFIEKISGDGTKQEAIMRAWSFKEYLEAQALKPPPIKHIWSECEGE